MIFAGDTLYVGGNFSVVNGYTRMGVVGFENGSDVPSAWNPNLTGSPESVLKILPNSGNIYLGGDFDYVGGQAATNLVAVDAVSAELDGDWLPNPNDDVYAIAADGNELFVGGYFDEIAGVSRDYFANFDMSTGDLGDFSFGIDYTVTDIEVSQNSLFLSGPFETPQDMIFEVVRVGYTCPPPENIYGEESFEGSFPPDGWSVDTGDVPWVQDMSVASDGNYSVNSNDLTGGYDVAILSYEVNLAESATLTFDWKVSSESGYDFLYYCIDDPSCDDWEAEEKISGEVDWVTVVAPLTVGVHTITWKYEKDSSVDRGSDMGWVDNVSIDDADSSCTPVTENTKTSWNPEPGWGSIFDMELVGSAMYVGGDEMGFELREMYGSLSKFGSTASVIDLPSVEFSFVNRLVSESVGLSSIPITLSKAVGSSDVTVNYEVSGGSGVSGTDYVLNSGVATITAGSYSTSIPVTLNDNDDADGDRTVFLTLSDPSGANLGMYSVGSFTIVDDEGGGPQPSQEPTNTPTNTPTGTGSTSSPPEQEPTSTSTPTSTVAPTTLVTTTPMSSSLDVSIDLPGDNHYTNQTRPIFGWKINRDDGSEVYGYELEVDNGSRGDFSVGGIPSLSSDINQSRYEVNYKGFNDSVSDNNQILLFTKPSFDWSSNENDGRLKEGKRFINLKVDSDPDFSKDRSFFVDLTSPALELFSINGLDYDSKKNSYLINNGNLNIKASVKDILGGDTKENKVASGPNKIVIDIKKINKYWFDELVASAKVNLASGIYWCSDTMKIVDNKEQKDDKCADLNYTFENVLTEGNYLVSIVTDDQAGNKGQLISFDLVVGKQGVSEEVVEKGMKDNGGEKESGQAKKEEKKTAAGEEPAWKKLISDAVVFVKGMFENLIDGLSDPFARFIGMIQDGLNKLSFIPSTFKQSLISATENWFNAWFEDSRTKISDVKTVEIGNDFVVISWKTNHPATSKVNYGNSCDYGADVQSDVLVKNHIVKIEGLDPETVYYYEVMSHGKTYSYDARHEFITLADVVEVNVGIGDTGKLTPTETPTEIGGDTGGVFSKWLSKNDTKIKGLKITNISHNSAVVSWKTNHPATTVIKYSASTDLAYEVTSDVLTTEHRVVFEYLEPKTTYYFKAISFGRTLAESDMTDFNTKTIEWAIGQNLVSQTPTLTSTPTVTSTPVLSSLIITPSPTMTSTPTATSTPIPTLTLWPEVDQLVVETATPTVTLIVSPTPTETDLLISDVKDLTPTSVETAPQNDTSETPQTPLVRIVEVDKKDDVVSRTVDSVNQVRYDIQESPTLGRSTEVLAVATDVAVVVGLGQVLLVTMTSMFNALNYLLKSLPMTLFTSLRILFGNLPLLLIAPIIPLVRNKKKNIEGVVVGENGKPLRNALIVATFEGRVYISRTLIDGKFNLKIDSGRCVLVFIKKGFETQKRVINMTDSDKNKMIRVTMISRSKQSIGVIDKLIVGSYEMARGTKIGMLSVLMTILVWVYFIYPSVSSLMMILATMVYLAKSYLYREE